ncbi:Nphp3 [Symbiodinium pilosum]|uniref:Nphp3 protein n=1 Tax=Symbiodinium pilosum TaxID=2952 RepID=A0A812TX74_SYMPI|nr:Nphp3 [Symbiodinium pilosum]
MAVGNSHVTIMAVFDELREGEACLRAAKLPAAMRLLGMNPTEGDVSTLCQNAGAGSMFDGPSFVKLMQEALAGWLAKDQAQELLLSFQAFDTQSSGRITVEKLVQIMSMSGNPFTSEELEEMLFNAGIDGDGTLAYKDLILRHFFSPESGTATGKWDSLADPAGPIPPVQEATTLNEVAKLRAGRGDLEEAANLRGKALAILGQVHGPEHPDVAAALHALAGLKEQQGRVEEALDIYVRALSIREKVLGNNHFYVAMTLDSIANLKDRLGQVEEAMDFAGRSLSIWEKFFGPSHPHIARILFNLAGRRDSLGEVDESLRLYAQALSIQDSHNPESVEVADILGASANLRERLGEIAEALNLYTRELAVRQKLFGPSHPDVLELQDIIASLQT